MADTYHLLSDLLYEAGGISLETSARLARYLVGRPQLTVDALVAAGVLEMANPGTVAGPRWEAHYRVVKPHVHDWRPTDPIVRDLDRAVANWICGTCPHTTTTTTTSTLLKRPDA